jgi:hypothetical protein
LAVKPAAHEVPTRDVSLATRRNGPRAVDPLNMTNRDFFDYPHAAARLGSTQRDMFTEVRLQQL